MKLDRWVDLCRSSHAITSSIGRSGAASAIHSLMLDHHTVALGET